MRSEDLGPVAPVFEADEPVARIPGQLRQPAHQLRSLAVVLVIRGGCAEDRRRRVFLQVCDSGRIGSTRKQDERAHFGMPARQLHGIVHAAGSAARSDAALVDAGLSDEPCEGRIKIARPFVIQLPLHFGRTGIETRSAAFAEATVINRERADTCSAELLRDRLPGRARRVAHVHQQDRWTWSSGGKVGRLQARTVGRNDVHVAPNGGGCGSSRRRENHEEHQRCHAQILRLRPAFCWGDRDPSLETLCDVPQP